jgi:hypothetical protein
VPLTERYIVLTVMLTIIERCIFCTNRDVACCGEYISKCPLRQNVVIHFCSQLLFKARERAVQCGMKASLLFNTNLQTAFPCVCNQDVQLRIQGCVQGCSRDFPRVGQCCSKYSAKLGLICQVLTFPFFAYSLAFLAGILPDSVFHYRLYKR